MKISLFVRAVREPLKAYKMKKGHQHTSRTRGGGRAEALQVGRGGTMKLGKFVDSPDVINHSNFHCYTCMCFIQTMHLGGSSPQNLRIPQSYQH